jgi:hypothetical protein
MGSSKSPKEEDDEVEELHVSSKKQRIEKDRFVPPSFPSSSSLTINKTRVLISIHKDVGKEGKRKWRQFIKIPNITEV